MSYCIEVNIKLIVVSESKVLEPVVEKRAEKQVDLGSKVIRQTGITAARVACVLFLKELVSALFGT